MKRVVPALFLAALAAAPPAAAQETRIEVPYTRIVLDNGLNVLLHEDHTTPTVSVNLWYEVGSGRETPGHTGLAHLFEHLMFEGSAHVPEGKFDEWLEAAGGDNNAGTTSDWTDYYQDVPSNALELALFLESDRMGWLEDVMTPERVNGQRDVVKNERRQSYENRPYGMASILLDENLYPPDYPYHWPTIGSMDDLTAATYQDVIDFHHRWYGPNNASLAIAGDIDPAEAARLVRKWFGAIPAGPPVPPFDAPKPVLTEEKRVTSEDRVQLPRIYVCWLTPAIYQPGDAALDVLANVLTGGKNARLYKRLVYDMQIAQDVSAYQSSRELSSEFCIRSTARTGHGLDEIEAVIDQELARFDDAPPTDREVERAVHQFESGFLDALERVGGFGGKAAQLNGYYVRTGDPDWFNEDLARYESLDPSDVQAAARTYLRTKGRVVLSIVPEKGEGGS